jgi:hypothetical protein
VACRNRRTGQTRELLAEAVASCRRRPDVYKWAEVVVLADLLEPDPVAPDAESAAGVHREAHGLVADRIFAVNEGT